MSERSERLRVALRSGLLAGIALALAEAALLDGVEWLVRGPASFVSSDVRFRVALLLLYPIGISLAAVLLSLPWRSMRLAAVAGPVALLIVLTAHVLTIDATPSRVAIRVAACLIAFVAVWGLVRRDALLPVVARHGGWFVSIVSTLTLWILFERLAAAPRLVKLAAIAAVFICALLIVVAAEAIRVPRRLIAALALGIVVFTLTRKAAPPSPAVFAGKTPAAHAPDIVLVTMDTVRADHLSLYGYPRRTSPFLEEMAKSASLYRHAYAAGDMTLSSHASMFTGLWPGRHGAHPNASMDRRVMLTPFDGRVRTIAEVLRDRGYATAAIVANSGYLGAGLGLARGFAYYDARPGGAFGEGHHGSLRRRVALLASKLFPRVRAPHWRRAATVTDDALETARAARSTGRPLFLFVNYMDAHGPYDPPRAYLERVARGEIDGDPHRLIDRAFARMHAGVAPLTRDEEATLVDRYDAGIASIDDAVRRLVTSLSDDRDTLVIVTADHGESLGEHGLFDHGNGVYQTAIGVPMLIRYPRQRTAEVREEPVSGVDVALTIIRVAGARVPAGRDGIALEESAPIPLRILYSESFATGRWIAMNERFRRKEVAAIAGHMKFIARTNAKGELFDLAADPAEVHALAGESILARACASLLRESQASEPRPLDAETIEQLRSLGYLR